MKKKRVPRSTAVNEAAHGVASYRIWRWAAKRHSSASRALRIQPTWPEVSRSGEIVKTSIANVRAFLDYLGLKLWLNQFENRIRIDGSEKHQYLDDHVLSSLWGQANKLGFRPSKAFMRDALKSIAVDNGRHPLREFLKSLRWDGVPRAERLFIDYAHAEDNPLNRAIGKLLLVAMVRRIRRAWVQI